jgi:hypothetical protein
MPEGLGEYLLVTSNDETDGEYVEMEWTMPPGAFAPIDRVTGQIHPRSRRHTIAL